MIPIISYLTFIIKRSFIKKTNDSIKVLNKYKTEHYVNILSKKIFKKKHKLLIVRCYRYVFSLAYSY